MFADVVESMRLIERDELASVLRLRQLLHQIHTRLVPVYDGAKLMERRGDGVLITFVRASHAAACAHGLHALAEELNTGQHEQDHIRLRIGVHAAQVLAEEGSIYGRGINIAARLTGLAQPGQTVVSLSLRQGLLDGVDGVLHDLGERPLKHLAHPLRAFRLAPPSPGANAGAA